MQQPYLQTATSNSSIVPLQHTINHDPAFDQEWHAQFDAVDVKGKTPVTAIPQIQQQQNTHVHGDLDSWSQEFDKLDLKETKEFGEWDERFKELDFDLEGAKTEEEREEMMKKMGDLWKELQAEGERAGAGRVESGGVHNPWDGGYEDFLNGAQSVIDPDPVTAPWTEYKFESNNPFLGRIDALEQGLQILASPGGSLSQAALAFEAAVQLNQSNNSDAWMHLGKVQAENEKEDAAIIALHKSVQLNPSNISALMSLAISYTNEARELEAYATLNRWLSTKYPTIPETVAPAEYISKYEIHDASTARFLQAVKINSTSGLIDADLQLGLGVLFYNCQEFDKVIDCFTAALRVRSSDYLLWNRLGATLANSGRSEEAIEAYRKALELKPSFVRCRYNLGVSCINIGCYREAAEHLLGALSLHDVGGDHGGIGHINVSENLWDTLRRTFVQMRRMDLAELTQSDRDVNKFRKEFEF
ncbi:Peroxisomal membrane signal receptor PTS1 [Physocladia obscura]|uniref:Peroxisomal membrane signal receptor PTS1 n=1 Tax=Physocladia obscura TaxID=109957 RepID=A0AAD5T190_9FUNG|nr:Peroxisomal membrane signal receptor PTS1 [Physocladia obscura]